MSELNREARPLTESQAETVVGDITRTLRQAGVKFKVFDLGKFALAPFDPQARCNCLGCRIRRAAEARN